MEPRIIAVDDVELQAPNGTESDLAWFYAELIGLRLIEPDADDHAPRLRFRSDRIELRITFVENNRADSIDFRVHCAVPSLDQTAAALDERRYPYQLVRGLRGTDRALSLLDPAGHRVEIRRAWPDAPL